MAKTAKTRAKSKTSSKKQSSKRVNYSLRGTLIISAAVTALTLFLIAGIAYENTLF